MTLDFDEELHRQKLILNIKNKCVSIPKSINIDLKEIVEWCNNNIGYKRLYHPIYEAEQGWIDYFDGEWAYTVYEGEHSIWIMDENKRKSFQMVAALKWLY